MIAKAIENQTHPKVRSFSSEVIKDSNSNFSAIAAKNTINAAAARTTLSPTLLPSHGLCPVSHLPPLPPRSWRSPPGAC